MNALQKSLLSNGLFSLGSGVALILLYQKFAQWFEVEYESPFWIIGIGLILFSILVLVEVRRQQPLGVLLIVVQDVLWVLASFVLLVTMPFAISDLGNQLIAVVAIVVLFFALAQSRALAQVDSLPDKKMKRFVFEGIVMASKERTWEAISDVGNYHAVAPNVDEVKIIEGEGEGMIRSCAHGNERWTESCTLWEEGKQYAFEVNTNAPDYPFPLKYLKGSWKVEEISKDQSRIIMIFDFAYRKKIYNVILHPFMKGRFNKIGNELLSNWQKMLGNKGLESYK